MDLQAALDRRTNVEAFRRKHRTRLLTLVFTDLVGSTQLKQTLGDLAAVSLMQEHHVLVRQTLARFPEAEAISTAGDAFFLVFVKPSDAVRFSLQLLAGLRQLSQSAGRPIQDRIGIHIGEVVIEEHSKGDKPRDFYGIQVDIAARIQALAEGGQILLSRFAFDNARQVLRGQDLSGMGAITWLTHGPYFLKGVEDAVEICEVGEDGCAPLKAPPNSEKASRRPPASGREVEYENFVAEVLRLGGDLTTARRHRLDKERHRLGLSQKSANEIERACQSRFEGRKSRSLTDFNSSLVRGPGPWKNSLGIQFAPIPRGETLLGLWPVRVCDYQKFAHYKRKPWQTPAFPQGPDHPAVYVSWYDATEFCAWLTQKERAEGVLGPNLEYRLPDDAEWSLAVGLPPEAGRSPREKSGQVPGVYPWGTQWPPPHGAGNYCDKSWRDLNPLRAREGSEIARMRDGFAYTSPVTAFSENPHGFYDLGGNVWEWCRDPYEPGDERRVLRGASWRADERRTMLSSYRYKDSPNAARGSYGFRLALAKLGPA